MKPLILVFLSLFSLSIFAQKVDLTDEEIKWIQENPTIEFGFSPEWKPFEIVEDRGYKGIAQDFLHIISNKTGLTFKGVYQDSWEVCTESFKRKEIRMIPCLIKTDERLDYMRFSKAYAQSPVVIVTQRDYPYVQDLHFLKGKKVAMAKGYSNTEFLEANYPDIEIVYVKNTQEAIELLSFGKVDATVENLPIASYYMYYEGYSNLKIAAPVSDLSSVKVHISVQPEDSILISIINKAIEDIYPEDKNEIFAKWIAVKHDQTKEVYEIIKIAAVIIGVILILLIVIIFWNKRLKKEVELREVSEHHLEHALGVVSRQNDEKKILLKEIHHRVKNNLQVINSLLSLQSLETEDERALAIFKDAQGRVVTMALLHEKLYQTTDIDNLDISEHFDLLAKEMIDSFSSSQNVNFKSALTSASFDSKLMVSLGLILNEFITNSMKYAFNGINDPEIFLGFKVLGKEKFELVYTDNGVGASKDLLTSNHESLGITLIKTLTEQIDGQIEQMDVNGTGFKLQFSYQAKER